MTEQVGADSAQTTAAALMIEVYAKYNPADRAELHDAILAERTLKDRESKMLTEWAEVVRAGEVERHGSQRAAAEVLNVARRTVRPRSNGKAKQ